MPQHTTIVLPTNQVVAVRTATLLYKQRLIEAWATELAGSKRAMIEDEVQLWLIEHKFVDEVTAAETFAAVTRIAIRLREQRENKTRWELIEAELLRLATNASRRSGMPEETKIERLVGVDALVGITEACAEDAIEEATGLLDELIALAEQAFEEKRTAYASEFGDRIPLDQLKTLAGLRDKIKRSKAARDTLRSIFGQEAST